MVEPLHRAACNIIGNVLKAFEVPKEKQCIKMWDEAEIPVKSLLEWYAETEVAKKEIRW